MLVAADVTVFARQIRAPVAVICEVDEIDPYSRLRTYISSEGHFSGLARSQDLPLRRRVRKVDAGRIWIVVAIPTSTTARVAQREPSNGLRADIFDPYDVMVERNI